LKIYTASGEPTTEFKSRGEVHKDGDWHATVHLWVINSKNELLFQKRSESAEIYPGLWDLSAAGHVTGADSFIQSVEREALEELGLKIEGRDAQFLFTITTELHTATLNECVYQQVYLIRHDIELNQLTLQCEEVSEVEWRHYSVLRELMIDAGVFVPRYEEYQKLLHYLEGSFIQ